MNLSSETTSAASGTGDAVSRWLGRRLAWERRLTELRADAAGTPRLTPRARPSAASRRVA